MYGQFITTTLVQRAEICIAAQTLPSMPLYTRVPADDQGYMLVTPANKLAKLQELYASYRRAYHPRTPVEFVEAAECKVRSPEP